MQFLQAPAVLDELRGQPVQQIGMRGRFGSHAKVAGSLDQACTKMVCPHAIGDYPRGEWVRRINDPLGEFQSSAAFLERLAIFPCQQSQELARHFVSERVVIKVSFKELPSPDNYAAHVNYRYRMKQKIRNMSSANNTNPTIFTGKWKTFFKKLKLELTIRLP